MFSHGDSRGRLSELEQAKMKTEPRIAEKIREFEVSSLLAHAIFQVVRAAQHAAEETALKDLNGLRGKGTGFERKC